MTVVRAEALPEAIEADWRRPRPSPAAYRRDALLAVALTVGAWLSSLLYGSAGFYDKPAPLWVGAVCIAASTLPLALRRRHPEIVAIACAIGFVVTQTQLVPEVLVTNITLFIALYTVGAWGLDRPRANVVRWIIIGGMFAWLFIAFLTTGSWANAFADTESSGPVTPAVAYGLITVLTNALYFGGAYYFGDRSWLAARQRAELEARSAQLADERERSAARAVALERVRIARELHDVVAHHVSVMGVQAGAARRVLEKDPRLAATSLTAIESSARDAVDELHRMLSTLRDVEGTTASTDADSAAIEPSTRGLEQLPALLAEADAAGLTTRLTTVGDPRPLPGTTGLTLYRIVQESLTNALKHAGVGASVDLRVRYLPDTVEVEVADDGAGSRVPAQRGAGLGHVGMRERIAAVGGTIEIGPRSRGGYLVRATAPAPAAVAPAPAGKPVAESVAAADAGGAA